MPKCAKSVFCEMYHVCDDGMSQRSVRQLEYQDDPNDNTRITTTTTLPSCLLPEQWAQAKWSDNDVKLALENVSVQTLWLSCLVHGIDVIPSCLKPSTARIDDIGVGYRREAVLALIEIKNSHLTRRHQHSSLENHFKKAVDDPRQLETTAFPMVEVSSTTLHRLLQIVCPSLVAFSINTVTDVFEWQSQIFLPTLIRTDNIVLRRLVAHTHWLRSNRAERVGICHVPIMVEWKHKFFIVADDGICVCKG